MTLTDSPFGFQVYPMGNTRTTSIIGRPIDRGRQSIFGPFRPRDFGGPAIEARMPDKGYEYDRS